MKTLASYIRVVLFMTIAYFFLDYVSDGNMESTVLWTILGIFFMLVIATEIVVEALKSILYRSLDDEGQARFDSGEGKQLAWIKSTYEKLKGTRPMEEEADIILDHNYDGIKELDNVLPPWWVYGFYITIIFAVVYLARYHIFDGATQIEEFEAKMEEAQLAVEEYKKTAKDLVDASTVTLLTEPSDLAAGKEIFEGLCVACHKADMGGGIGPNLTDEYWILGGGISNVFNTIMEGGRPGKGMVPWKTELKPGEVAQVASYILSMQGTTPAEPKAPEGEIWVDPDAAPEDGTPMEEIPVDSTAVGIEEPVIE